jgi:hypothetical protein
MNQTEKLFGKRGSSLFRKGIELFNAGKHWEAHEVFEDVWRMQKGDAKRLAQGFVQMAAGFAYIKKKRFSSIAYLFDKSSEKFALVGHLLPQVNISELVDAMSAAKREVERLGEEHVEKFQSSLYPRIVFPSPHLRSKKIRR